jgi:hypothetical protein
MEEVVVEEVMEVEEMDGGGGGGGGGVSMARVGGQLFVVVCVHQRTSDFGSGACF